MLFRPHLPWAKLSRADLGTTGLELARGPVVAWCSLLDHSADVAAVLAAILEVACVRRRLSILAGEGEILPRTWNRLVVLAAIHDFGKANWGFRARWQVDAPPIGHVREAWMAVTTPEILRRLLQALPLRECDEWFGPGALAMAIGHHGTPVDPTANDRDDRALWTPRGSEDPIAALAPLGEAIRQQWLREAFAPDGERPLKTPAWAMISGLLTLADWIASDENLFPLAPVDRPEIGAARFAQSRARAVEILRGIGFDPVGPRHALAREIEFPSVSPHPPRPIQLAAAADDDPALTIVLESETGSGKTEAALFRFARLFAAGKVDGLYFALPTRVAATALHERVENAVERLWPEASTRPPVILAVPGQELDRARALDPPAGGHDAWDDVPKSHEDAWAASRPKKYLAGTIAVGTIDQALLAIIKAKHAHLRLACLTRHLLVVDEVHASDRYMETLLSALLRFHRGAGGHALLLSATLGARARAAMLGRGKPPPLAEAIAAPYPALSFDTRAAPIAQPWEGRSKDVALTLSTTIGDPDAVAQAVIDAAREGAKVLVIRNLRRDAIATFDAIRRLAPDAPLLMCRGVATLHHGRFAREDRRRLDAAVAETIGKTRGGGGRIVVGTQTLEQSLDICADFLVTDIAPADVLLQRLGRLHRHDRGDRPTGYRAPRAIVLAPPDMAALIGKPAHGLGARDTFTMPYADLIAVEATRRLIVEHPVWSIPAMNRLLVERATHPEARAEWLEAWLGETRAWERADIGADGRTFAHRQAAGSAVLRTDIGFDDPGIVFPRDEYAATRLGAKDAIVELPAPVAGPFGEPVRSFLIPSYWGVDPSLDVTPRQIDARDGEVSFEVQGRPFAYDARGLDQVRD